MSRVLTRLEKLEQARGPQQRVWHICRAAGESAEQAVHRHGVALQPHDWLILHRYGRCSQCAGGLAPRGP